jgi:Fur family ferric uptake transcriptional regulator
MTQTSRDIESFLKENGLSVTRQRLYVFKLLEGSEPLSMHELYVSAKGHLDRASLYRIIATFEELGVVQRINIGWKYKLELSDTFAEHHHHLTCLKCQRIIPINESELEAFIKNVSDTYAFTPSDHQVEIQGYCKNCQPG